MDYEWDEEKNARNRSKHRLSFDRVEDAVWSEALILSDLRRNYGEKRFLAYVPIDGRLHAIIYVDRGRVRRIISLRKANKKERRFYDQETF